ncbi:MAG: cytochrome c [Flavobacteriaceae bacterium]|nr:cytochrome c [Flavobacteriaceae bacterium]
MKAFKHIALLLLASFAMVSCFDSANPNYQYMPNMYEPVGYDTYGEYEIFPGEQEAMLPPEGTIPRGWQPYEYENSNDGLLQAKAELKNPLEVTEQNLESGKALYEIYCAVCHGSKGDGQGILVKNEKILGIPSYADPGRVINEGGTYHVMMFGLNSMGSYASQTDELERWQIVQHVMNLKATLEGTPLLSPTSNEEVSADAEASGASEANSSEEQN